MKDEQSAGKREIAEPRRNGSAVSPDDSAQDIDFLIDDIEARLSCPHANSIFLSETQMHGIEISALALDKPIAITFGVIAAPDCIQILMLQPPKWRKLKNPSMQNPGGAAISGEVIVGQQNPVFQGGNTK